MFETGSPLLRVPIRLEKTTTLPHHKPIRTVWDASGTEAGIFQSCIFLRMVTGSQGPCVPLCCIHVVISNSFVHFKTIALRVQRCSLGCRPYPDDDSCLQRMHSLARVTRPISR